MGRRNLISLESALELRAGHLTIPRPNPADPAIGEWYWRDSWLPAISGGNEVLYVDTNMITAADLRPVFRGPAWEKGWDVPSDFVLHRRCGHACPID
jgi:hypothetical protein